MVVIRLFIAETYPVTFIALTTFILIFPYIETVYHTNIITTSISIPTVLTPSPFKSLLSSEVDCSFLIHLFLQLILQMNIHHLVMHHQIDHHYPKCSECVLLCQIMIPLLVELFSYLSLIFLSICISFYLVL